MSTTVFVTTCGSVFDVRAIIFFFGRLNPFSYLSRLLLHGGWFPLPLPQKFHSLRYIILQTDCPRRTNQVVHQTPFTTALLTSLRTCCQARTKQSVPRCLFRFVAPNLIRLYRQAKRANNHTDRPLLSHRMPIYPIGVEQVTGIGPVFQHWQCRVITSILYLHIGRGR